VNMMTQKSKTYAKLFNILAVLRMLPCLTRSPSCWIS